MTAHANMRQQEVRKNIHHKRRIICKVNKQENLHYDTTCRVLNIRNEGPK